MIEFKDVKKIYPNGTVALDGIDLKIADGEFVFIVGESGAGKTTLMKLLLREEKITSGSLIVRSEKQVGKQDSDYRLQSSRRLSNFRVPYYRRELGVVFQDFRLFPNKTVFENVAFAMPGSSGESKPRHKTPRPGAAQHRQPHRQIQKLPDTALGRRAAESRPREGARQQSADHHRRRADRQHRPEDEPRDHEPAHQDT